MSQVLAEMRRTYAAQRGVSQGASLTLVSASGGYTARFECATRCALALGDRNLVHAEPPLYLIPTESLHKSITKLAESFSVALVDTTTDDAGTRFVLVWKIQPKVNPAGLPEETVAAPEPDPNQGSLDLDEY